jgi:hypothetical protein
MTDLATLALQLAQARAGGISPETSAPPADGRPAPPSPGPAPDAPSPAGRPPGPGAPLPRSVVSPWPDTLPGLGPRRIGPFTPCSRCQGGTWVRFGDRALCLACALAVEAAPDLVAAGGTVPGGAPR